MYDSSYKGFIRYAVGIMLHCVVYLRCDIQSSLFISELFHAVDLLICLYNNDYIL
jgi:hypothetical protein